MSVVQLAKLSEGSLEDPAAAYRGRRNPESVRETFNPPRSL